MSLSIEKWIYDKFSWMMTTKYSCTCKYTIGNKPGYTPMSMQPSSLIGCNTNILFPCKTPIHQELSLYSPHPKVFIVGFSNGEIYKLGKNTQLP